MKKAAAFTLIAGSLFLAGCCTVHRTAHWEYMTQRLYINGDFQAETLNGNAREGWEFVSATPIPDDPNKAVLVVFKRRVP